MVAMMDALEYHERTGHSAASIQANRHFLDWPNQPLPFKIYSTLEPIPLPKDLQRPPASAGTSPDLGGLAYLLHYTGGITRKKVYPDGREHHFRAAACTGALYHIDLYVVCAELPDLEAGVYHFGPHDFSLRRLRRGDHRKIIIDASADEPATAQAPILIVCASTFWRNAWKYQSRAYRHCFWDSGTMLANLLAVADTAAVPARVVVGFADDPLNTLLGLDTKREVVLSYVALGRSDSPIPAAPRLEPLALETTPLSKSEVDYPAIRAAHAGSALDTPQAARRWREQASRRPLPQPRGSTILLVPSIGEAPLPIEQTIKRRGSSRRFAREPIALDALSRMLRAAAADLPSDFSIDAATDTTGSVLLNDLYLIVNAVDGLASGTYVHRPERGALELLQAGDFRREAGYLDLGQELSADASVNFYLLCDLERIVARFGNRGYRAAALEAAIIGGRIYLEAYALRLGATGLTFFDDDVTSFFSPHAAGKEVMFLNAVGIPYRKGRSRSG
jgi:SagB-type dehydrogenase family enzyme